MISKRKNLDKYNKSCTAGLLLSPSDGSTLNSRTAYLSATGKAVMYSPSMPYQGQKVTKSLHGDNIVQYRLYLLS